jgi:hypothetical protein
MSIFLGPTQNYVSTTLNGTITDSIQTITLNDASKMQAPGYIVIDREDGNGTSTPNSREIVYFTGISGNDLTGCERAADNSTARSHSDGALVEAVLTVGMWNSLATSVSASLNEGGTGLHISDATITAITQSARFVGTSIASVSWGAFKQMAVSSVASVAVLHASAHLNASGASVTGIDRGGFMWQVPGSLASQANIGGMVIVPAGMTASHLMAYVQTPSSIASVSAFILKQGGTVVGMLGILGGGTYGSSASLAVTSLVAGDNLTLDIRSTASLASDLSIVMRTV